MRCACIDIGSNTTRLLVADAAAGRLVPVLQQRAFTRIAPRLDEVGAIPEATIAAVAEVVAAQLAAAEVAGAAEVRVVATAAIRHAANRDALVAALRKRAGVEVAVLSGDDEGRLAFAGATRTLERPPAGTIAVVDVGGMSTEIAIGTMAGGVTWLRSFAIGSAMLAGRCREDPPSRADVDAMKCAAAAAFAAADVPPLDHAVAVGGSAASLRRLVGDVLDAGSLERAIGALSEAPAADVARRLTLDARRVRLLPAGIVILGAAAEQLRQPLRIGRGGLREGAVLDMGRSL
jgi:exopolyphosphatase / guanosine-5'-triphosphate,3'-diphosphate pyrophosphatase